MSVKEQPQFNMSAVFTSRRGPDEPLTVMTSGQGMTVSPPVPASLTPEIDAVMDDVIMKWVKNGDAENDEEDDDDERDREPRNPSLNVTEQAANADIERTLHEPFAMGDPPSLPGVTGVTPIGRTYSTPLFNSSSGSSMIGLGLGNTIARPTPSRLSSTLEPTTVDGDSLPFHFGGSTATLSKPSNSAFLGSNTLGGSSIDGLGLFSPPLVPQIEPKSTYTPLGPGFSLTPPATSTDSSNPFAPSGSMGFTPLVPLSSPLSQSSSPASVSPSGSSSPPQMQLLFNHHQQPQQLQPSTQQQQQQQPQQPQPQPQLQPKLQPPPQQQPHVQSTQPSSQTHFVGTAAVFVPKSMMTPPPAAPEAASSAPGNIQFAHKEFNSYNHPGMYAPGVANEGHGDVSFTPQTGGYNVVESSNSPQPSSGMNGNNYRTKGCWYFFQTGHCQKGERCNFSHDRVPGMEIPPPGPSGNVPGMYLQPMPPYGYGVPPDVPMVGSPRTMAKSNPFVVPPAGAQQQAPQSQQVVQPPPQPTSPPNFVAVQQLYRTKPCRFFFEKGTCLKGDRCNFSHDPVYAAAYAANNPSSGFQMPDMSRFTNTANGGSAVVGNGNNVPNTASGNTVTNGSNGTNGNGMRGNGNGGGGGGNRHQPPGSATGSSLLTTSAASSRLSSASEVDFPPLG